MTGCPVCAKCAVACRCGLESQHPTCPQVRHIRRCAQFCSPSAAHSSQRPGVLAAGSAPVASASSTHDVPVAGSEDPDLMASAARRSALFITSHPACFKERYPHRKRRTENRRERGPARRRGGGAAHRRRRAPVELVGAAAAGPGRPGRITDPGVARHRTRSRSRVVRGAAAPALLRCPRQLVAGDAPQCASHRAARHRVAAGHHGCRRARRLPRHSPVPARRRVGARGRWWPHRMPCPPVRSDADSACPGES